MRILILALGSRGDVLPYAVLGQALQAAGHRVAIATFESFRPMIAQAGPELYAIPGDAETMLKVAAQGGMLDRRSHPLQVMRALARSYGQLASLPALGLDMTVLRGIDLILNQLPAHLYGPDIAEYLGIPWAIVAVMPLVRTRHRPLVGTPTALSGLPGYNLLTYRLGEQMGWQLFRGAINRWRRQVGLRPQPLSGPYGEIQRRHVPFINGFSEQVVPRAPDWGEHVHLTGWWYPREPDWQPPPDLLSFLEAGPPPVFFGLGSMPVSDPARVTAIVVETVRLTGRRAILHAGWAGLGGDLPPEIFPMTYAPYGWLFPRMAAIVHHGGSGTTGFALASGVPSLVVPFVFDQFYWGERTAALCAGPRPVPYRELGVERLAAAIDTAVNDASIRTGAARLGETLRAEDGVGKAVALVERLI